jgi:ribosomal protein S27AE
MTHEPTCQYCGHQLTPMPPSSFDAEHPNTRYQCGNCMRVVSLPRIPPFAPRDV